MTAAAMLESVLPFEVLCAPAMPLMEEAIACS
jgi:hypothetical protein